MHSFQDKGIVGNKKATRDASDGSKDYSLLVYSSLLKNEILGTSIEDFKEAASYANSPSIGLGNGNTGPDSNTIQGNAVVNAGGNNSERRNANGNTAGGCRSANAPHRKAPFGPRRQ